jgi:chloramphenicol 3-O-phosphotransferase
MAESQALAVHQGVVYDVEVDTTATPPEACVRSLSRRLGERR